MPRWPALPFVTSASFCSKKISLFKKRSLAEPPKSAENARRSPLNLCKSAKSVDDEANPSSIFGSEGRLYTGHVAAQAVFFMCAHFIPFRSPRTPSNPASSSPTPPATIQKAEPDRPTSEHPPKPPRILGSWNSRALINKPARGAHLRVFIYYLRVDPDSKG